MIKCIFWNRTKAIFNIDNYNESNIAEITSD